VFHSLVVLAARFGQVDLAELQRGEAPEHVVTVSRWHFDDPPNGVKPVVAHENETLWLATATPPAAAARPACWVEVVDVGTASDFQVPSAPDQVWQERFVALLTMTPLDSAELVALLQELDPGERQKALTSLVELVRLKGLHATQDVPRDGVMIPLVVKRDDGSEVWVDVHHPLVDANVAPSSVRAAAEADFVEFCSLDAFTLRHDLPGAYEVLQL